MVEGITKFKAVPILMATLSILPIICFLERIQLRTLVHENWIG